MPLFWGKFSDMGLSFRRKKVTSEWRNFVRPVLWRCQWLELRMKELSSQVSKYDRELALIKKEKELQQAVSKANGSMSEPVQIHKGHGNSIMKRRKRKRHEQNVDASLYINKHEILSYYNGPTSNYAYRFVGIGHQFIYDHVDFAPGLVVNDKNLSIFRR